MYGTFLPTFTNNGAMYFKMSYEFDSDDDDTNDTLQKWVVNESNISSANQIGYGQTTADTASRSNFLAYYGQGLSPVNKNLFITQYKRTEPNQNLAVTTKSMPASSVGSTVIQSTSIGYQTGFHPFYLITMGAWDGTKYSDVRWYDVFNNIALFLTTSTVLGSNTTALYNPQYAPSGNTSFSFCYVDSATAELRLFIRFANGTNQRLNIKPSNWLYSLGNNAQQYSFRYKRYYFGYQKTGNIPTVGFADFNVSPDSPSIGECNFPVITPLANFCVGTWGTYNGSPMFGTDDGRIYHTTDGNNWSLLVNIKSTYWPTMSEMVAAFSDNRNIFVKARDGDGLFRFKQISPNGNIFTYPTNGIFNVGGVNYNWDFIDGYTEMVYVPGTP